MAFPLVLRKDDLAALQAKENQRQLLNATKRGAAGMGAAGRAGADDGGLLSSENIYLKEISFK